MLVLYIDVVIIHNKYQGAFAKSRLVPVWIFYLCSIVGIVASIFGIYVIFTASWTPLVSTAIWDIWMFGIVALSLLVAVGVFYIGQKTIESNISDEEIIEEVTR